MAFWAFNSYFSVSFGPGVPFFVFGFLGQDGYVSIYVPEGYRLGIASGIALGPARMWNKKEQALHANINELIVFQDIARYRFW